MAKAPPEPDDPLAPLSGYIVASDGWKSARDHWVPGIRSLKDAKSLVAYWRQDFMPPEVRDKPHRIVKVTVTFEYVDEDA